MSDSDGGDSDTKMTIPEIEIEEMDFSLPISDQEQMAEPLDVSALYGKILSEEEKLFPAARVTKMQAITILMSWFSVHPGVSKEAFSKLLHVLHTQILPPGNILPDCYKDACKSVQEIVTPRVDYHCCKKDCIIFRGLYADLKECPKCKEPRFHDDNTPRKKFSYLPLEMRLRRMFSQKATAKLFQSHSISNDQQKPSGHERGSGKVQTLHDTEMWKSLYSDCGVFKGDKRAVVFGLCTDGLNPFSREKSSYSMWPIILFPLNFPSSLRKLSSSMMLVGIIPGDKQMNDINPYMEIVADDVKSLNGLDFYDAHSSSCKQQSYYM